MVIPDLWKNYLKLRNLVIAAKRPSAVFGALKQVLIDYPRICISIGTKPEELNLLVKEVKANKEFTSQVLGKLRGAEDYLKARGLSTGAIGETLAELIYAIVRFVKPDVVLETGVASGLSSSYILCALEKNERGRLFSIDLPYEEGKTYAEGYLKPEGGIWPVPKGLQAGWIIPDKLKHRWELILGRSSEKLPAILQQLKSIDIFLHDSEHSYETMRWEYHTVWPHLRYGGLLLSHDIEWNDAFSEFCKWAKGKDFVWGRGFGGMVKSS